MITLEQLYELYEDTLHNCGTYLLNESIELIELRVFEEFDIGVISFFHDESLQKLHNGNLISKTEMEKVRDLREMVFFLQENGEWNISSFKNSNNWLKILKLADEIKECRSSY